MTQHATGDFDVDLKPVASYDPAVGRMSIDKQFRGDLAATSKGEMLAVGGGEQGSAAYVAMERVTGTLHGKRGTFALHHTGIMNRGAPSLTIWVVPDSGTDELKGIAGAMQIIISGDKHVYTFDYTLDGRR